MWGHLQYCGGDDKLPTTSYYSLAGTHCFFGRAPQSVPSKDPEVVHAIKQGTVDYCVLEPAYVSINHFLIKRVVTDQVYDKVSTPGPKSSKCTANATLYLVDLSTNGTYVNGKLVGKHNQVEISSGAQISIRFKNKIRLVFEFKLGEEQQKQEKDATVVGADTVSAVMGTATQSTGSRTSSSEVLTRVTINQQQTANNSAVAVAGDGKVGYTSPHGYANLQRIVKDEPLKSQDHEAEGRNTAFRGAMGEDTAEAAAKLQLQLAKQEVLMLSHQMDDYQKQLDLIKIQTEEQHQQDQGQINRYRKELDEHVIQLADKTSQLRELESVAATYGSRQHHLEERIAELESERRALVQQVAQQTGELAELRLFKSKYTGAEGGTSSSSSGCSSSSGSSGSSGSSTSSSTSSVSVDSPAAVVLTTGSSNNTPAKSPQHQTLGLLAPTSGSSTGSSSISGSLHALQKLYLAEMAQRQALEQEVLKQKVVLMELEEKIGDMNQLSEETRCQDRQEWQREKEALVSECQANLAGWNESIQENNHLQSQLQKQKDARLVALRAFQSEFLGPLVSAALDADRGAKALLSNNDSGLISIVDSNDVNAEEEDDISPTATPAVVLTTIADRTPAHGAASAAVPATTAIGARKLTVPSALQSPIRPRGITGTGANTSATSGVVVVATAATTVATATSPTVVSGVEAIVAMDVDTDTGVGRPSTTPVSVSAPPSAPPSASASNNTSSVMSHSIRLDYSQGQQQQEQQQQQRQQGEEQQESSSSQSRLQSRSQTPSHGETESMLAEEADVDSTDAPVLPATATTNISASAGSMSGSIASSSYPAPTVMNSDIQHHHHNNDADHDHLAVAVVDDVGDDVDDDMDTQIQQQTIATATITGAMSTIVKPQSEPVNAITTETIATAAASVTIASPKRTFAEIDAKSVGHLADSSECNQNQGDMDNDCSEKRARVEENGDKTASALLAKSSPTNPLLSPSETNQQQQQSQNATICLSQLLQSSRPVAAEVSIMNDITATAVDQVVPGFISEDNNNKNSDNRRRSLRLSQQSQSSQQDEQEEEEEEEEDNDAEVEVDEVPCTAAEQQSQLQLLVSKNNQLLQRREHLAVAAAAAAAVVVDASSHDHFDSSHE